MERWISLNEFAALTNRQYIAARVYVNRNTFLETRYEIIPTGRQLQISLPSLLSHSILTPAQAEKFLLTQKLSLANSDGNRLLAAAIVAKKFENLTESELELLNALGNWRAKKKEEIIEIFVSSFGRSRAWFYRNHATDKRKEKDGILESLTTEQLESAKKYLLQSRSIQSFAVKCINDENLPDVSTSTWRRLHADLSVEMCNELDLMKEGRLQMRNRLAPILRDKTTLKVMEAATSDFWRIDFVVKWLDGSLARPSACFIEDWRTGKIVGRAITRFPNSLGVKTALFDCFLHHGIMKQFNIDNGKEFVAHRVVGTKIEQQLVKIDYSDVEDKLKVFETRGFLPSLIVKSHRALKRNPISKTIERRFGRGGPTDWAKEFSNWSGANYWQKREVVARAERKFRKGEQKDFVDANTGEIVHFMEIDELISAIDEFVNRHNNRPSSGFGMDGKTPNQLWDELVKLDPPRRAPVEKIAFSFLEGPEKPRRIRMSGYIELKKHFFFASDVTLRMRGRWVFLRWNPIDGFWWHRGDDMQFEFLPNNIFVYDENGEYLTTVKFVDRQHPLEAGENVSALMSRKMNLIKETEETVNHLLTGKAPVVDVKTVPDEIVAAAAKKRAEKKADDEDAHRKEIAKKYPTII